MVFLYFFGIIAVIIGSIVIYKYINQYFEIQDLRYNHYLEIFHKKNIEHFQYLRHRIILKFFNINDFDLNGLKELGGEDLKVDDNTLSFKFNGDNDNNYILYLKIKEKLEG